jgi:hypothetical protein
LPRPLPGNTRPATVPPNKPALPSAQRLLLALLLALLGGCSALPHTLTQNTQETDCTSIHHLIRLPGLPSAIRQQLDTTACTNTSSTTTSNSTEHSLLGLQPVITSLQPDERFEAATTLLDNSPDGVEKSTLPAHFAHELAHYLEDADYACRFPVYGGYFARRYQTRPDFSHCPSTVPFFLLDSRIGGQLVQLDPTRVRAVHLLYSVEGATLQSSFGHVALRLIVCPTADASDHECAVNLQQQVILGFMGRVDDLVTNPVKGMLGGYDAHLSAFTFREIYRNNALFDDRSMYSLPLQLPPDSIHQMVRELAEIHWSYRGKYRFFTNNCATLLQDTLAQMLDGYQQDEQLADGFLRPDTFFAAARTSPLADASGLQDLASAERNGYYFSSNQPYYHQALKALASNRRNNTATSLDDYLDTSGLQHRHWIEQDPLLLDAITRDPHLLEAQQLLEEYVLWHRWRALNKLTIKYLVDVATPGYLQQLHQEFSNQPDMLDFLHNCYEVPLERMGDRLPRANGLPDSNFLVWYQNPVSDCMNASRREQVRHAIDHQIPGNSDFRQQSGMLADDIKETLNNLTWLKTLASQPHTATTSP